MEITYTVTAVSTSSPNDNLCATRFNFVPDSIDKRGGRISIAPSGEVSATFSNTNSKKDGDDHCFSGNQVSAKDYEYVLIVDHASKTARIEKINQVIMLRNVRRSRRLSSGASPKPASPSHKKRSADECEIDELHADIFGHDFIVEICAFSGAKIYPGHGVFFVRGDSKGFRLVNAKAAVHFKAKKNPRKFSWTVFYRRLHKKGTTEEVAKRRARKTVKVQRAIVGATWDEIVAIRSEPESAKKAARAAASEDAKKKKKDEEAKKRAEKIKSADAAGKQPKFKATQNIKSSRVQATSR